MLYLSVPMFSNSWLDTIFTQIGVRLRELLTLRVQRDCAVFELMKRSVVIFINLDEFLFESFQFVFILRVGLHQEGQFLLELVQVSSPPVDVFLGFEKEYFLFFVVRLHLLGKSIFAILEHFNQHFKFLI